MNWYTNALMALAMKLLAKSMPFITDKLRELLKEGLDKAQAYAETTSYDLDNQVVEILRGVLGIPGDETETPAAACIPAGTATVEVTGPVVGA